MKCAICGEPVEDFENQHVRDFVTEIMSEFYIEVKQNHGLHKICGAYITGLEKVH